MNKNIKFIKYIKNYSSLPKDNKYNLLIDNHQKYELINKFIVNKRYYFNSKILFKNLKYTNNSKHYNNINIDLYLANSLINNENIISRNIFIKNYFYYNIVFVNIEDKYWMAFRITENINKHGYSKIYKAVLFKESFFNYSLKWIKIKELN